MIKPLRDKVVIQPAESKEQTKSGIFIPDTAKEKHQEGIVIAIGEGKKSSDGNRIRLNVNVGDKVIYSSYSGTKITIENKEYLIVNEDNILAVIG